MKAYITKFALTKGIVVAEGERDGKEGFVVRGAVPWDLHKFKLGEWHTDPAQAVKRAHAMAHAKFEAAEREAARLRAMEFPIGDLV